MLKQFMSLVAIAALLTACGDECADENKMVSGGFDNASTAAVSEESGAAADFQKNVKDTVHFAFDRSDLTKESDMILAHLADWLKKWPNERIVVEGHCDTRGTVEYNLGLGDRRAHAVKHYLVSQGIDGSRVETVSYGKERPVAQGTTEAEHAQNRRATAVIR